MSQIKTRRKLPPLPRQRAQLEKTLLRQSAWAAGSEFFQYRDPVYHITENFQQTFDAMGRKHIGDLTRAQGGPEEEAGPAPGPGQTAAPPGQTAAPPGQTGRGPESFYGGPGEERGPDPASSRAFYQSKNPEDQAALGRFSETAFQRGTLSAAVLQGTGRMMLFSCLKKTIGQSQPVREQQRRLFDGASPVRNVPGHIPDQVVFNRTFTDSAVGVVVDTLRDARRTVEDMQKLVTGGLSRTETGRYGAETLWKMYPFLDDSREKDLLEQYLDRLGDGEALSADERGLLQSAVDRTRTILDKKARMRVEFINKLRFLSDRASEALAEMEEPGFPAALDAALREALGAPPPPEGGDGPEEPDGEEENPFGATGAGGPDGPDGPAGGEDPGAPGPAGRGGPDPGIRAGPGGAGGDLPAGGAAPDPGGAGGPGG